MDNVFKMDVQRFNEGEPAPQEPIVEQPQQTEENDDFGVAIDSNGEIVFDEKFLENQDYEKPEEPQQPQQPNMYTPEELKATPFEKVDPWRLPPELQELYKSMQAPFSRATQQLAQQKAQYDAFLAQQQQVQQYQQPQAPQPPVEPQGVDRKAYVQKLFDTAKTVVEKDLGERYDELNPYHQAALVDTVTELKQQFYDQQAKVNQVQQVIGAFSSEPDWREIDAYANWRISKLPFEMAEPLMQRIKSGDAAALHAALSIARDELRAVKRQQQAPNVPQQQTQQRPPFVEQPGAGNANELARKPDFRAMKGKSTDELAKMVQSWGLV